MAIERSGEALKTSFKMDEKRLSIIVQSLFSSWMLAFLFEGQILYALADTYGLAVDGMVFGGVAAMFAGLVSCGFLIKTKKEARRLFLGSYIYFIATSVIFLFPPSVFWNIGIITSSLLAGGCVAAWGFYFKSSTPKNERIKTAADAIIYSNILMILLNMVAIHLTPRIGLIFSMLMLLGAFLFALRLPAEDDILLKQKGNPVSITGPLAFLCLFIVIITINSGLMYHVINPAYAHLKWLTSWYWAIPYIVAIFIMRNLPRKANRNHILYLAIAMIGFSFIAFVAFNRSASSYLLVNTLMLGACGIYDLFWWSILGEMLDFHENPAKLFGIGLSANVLGILLGGLIGDAIDFEGTLLFNSTLLAMGVVCLTISLLPLLHKHLSSLLADHIYLAAFSEVLPSEQSMITAKLAQYENLSERESQVAALLLQRKTYKAIAGELFISENTVKYYVKNIYSKFNVQSRGELIEVILGNNNPTFIK